MKRSFVLLLFLYSVCCPLAQAQISSKAQTFLTFFFQQFPVDSSQQYQLTYVAADTSFQEYLSPDSAAYNYTRKIQAPALIYRTPDSAALQLVAASSWGLADAAYDSAMLPSVTLYYGARNGHALEQFELLVKHLKKEVGKQQSYRIFTDVGMAGRGHKFYRQSSDVYPFLRIDVVFKTEAQPVAKLYITYFTDPPAAAAKE